MKRNILVSLMIIGAVAALVSGATFATFTSDDTVSGTLTTGTVVVTLDPSGSGEGSLSWTPDDGSCTSPLNSDFECTSAVSVEYSGNLAADLLFEGTTDDAGCFDVTWSSAFWGLTSGPTLNETVASITGTQTGDVTVVVSLTDPNNNDCQNTTINLTLTVTATEDLS